VADVTYPAMDSAIPSRVSCSLTASGGNATAADGPSPEKAHTRACRHIGVITGPPRGIASSPMASKPNRS
jgi:hypothetical protein